MTNNQTGLANVAELPSVTDGPYGPWVVVTADDGRRMGVAVTPHRVTTHLLIHDVDAPPRTFASLTLPPTSNPWIRAVAELSNCHSNYHWDTPAYRELCLQGGLDPDFKRPVFQPQNEEIGATLLIELNKVNVHSITLQNLMTDILDLVRVDPGAGAKSIETIRQEVQTLATYEPKLLDEVRELLSRLPALSLLRLV